MKSHQINCEYSTLASNMWKFFRATCLWKSLFSSLSNSLRKMSSQPWAKDKITAMSTEIIHGPYLSLKRDPRRPFSWVTATVSPDAWGWPDRSILKVSEIREKMGEVMQQRLKVREGQICRSSCRHLHKVTAIGRKRASALRADPRRMLPIPSRD